MDIGWGFSKVPALIICRIWKHLKRSRQPAHILCTYGALLRWWIPKWSDLGWFKVPWLGKPHFYCGLHNFRTLLDNLQTGTSKYSQHVHSSIVVSIVRCVWLACQSVQLARYSLREPWFSSSICHKWGYVIAKDFFLNRVSQISHDIGWLDILYFWQLRSKDRSLVGKDDIDETLHVPVNNGVNANAPSCNCGYLIEYIYIDIDIHTDSVLNHIGTYICWGIFKRNWNTLIPTVAGQHVVFLFDTVDRRTRELQSSCEWI